jgi:putative ABC transport system substrate-binding protein
LNLEILPKRLELLHELLPAASVIALLINPTDSVYAEMQSREALAAAHTLGIDLRVLNAGTERDFDSVFADLIHLRAGGLVIGEDAFFNSHIKQLAALTIHHSVPAVYKSREFVAAGGLLGYGSDGADAYRLAGTYTGRILKGDKPANLPVQQATKIELYINLKTARRSASPSRYPCPAVPTKSSNRSGFCKRCLLHLLTAVLGTKEPCRRTARESAYRGAAEACGRGAGPFP